MILRAAVALFARKGYAAATMSDLCAETGLSRGGLYRYFGSTAEAFLAILAADKEFWWEETHRGMAEGAPAPMMMRYYLDQMRQGIARGEGRISLAAYEFLRDPACPEGFASERFAAACEMHRKLLEYGVARGEFNPCDIRRCAEQSVVLLDGLRLAAATGLLTMGDIDEHLKLMYENTLLRKEEDK